MDQGHNTDMKDEEVFGTFFILRNNKSFTKRSNSFDFFLLQTMTSHRGVSLATWAGSIRHNITATRSDSKPSRHIPPYSLVPMAEPGTPLLTLHTSTKGRPFRRLHVSHASPSSRKKQFQYKRLGSPLVSSSQSMSSLQIIPCRPCHQRLSNIPGGCTMIKMEGHARCQRRSAFSSIFPASALHSCPLF